jgi:hypothetical protein
MLFLGCYLFLTPEHGSASLSSLDLIDRLITQTPDFSIALHVIDVTPVLLKPSQMQAFLAQQASRPVACSSIVVPPECYSFSVEQVSADLILLSILLENIRVYLPLLHLNLLAIVLLD